MDPNKKLIRNIMRSEFKLSYKRAKKLHPSVNSDKNIVLRQQYALVMLRLLSQGKRIINLDESWLNETSFIRKTWAERNGDGNASLHTVSPRVSMIAALDTNGNTWFTLSQANTDSNMIALFLHSLTKHLDKESPGWQEDTIFLWDNASYHSSEATKAIINHLGL